MSDVTSGAGPIFVSAAARSSDAWSTVGRNTESWRQTDDILNGIANLFLNINTIPNTVVFNQPGSLSQTTSPRPRTPRAAASLPAIWIAIHSILYYVAGRPMALDRGLRGVLILVYFEVDFSLGRAARAFGEGA